MNSSFSKGSGFILVTTLLLISLLSLLILSQMQLFLLDLKTLKLTKEKHQDFYNLETVANKLIQTIDLYESCRLDEEDPSLVIDLLKNKKGCSLTREKQNYYFVFEDLGIFPCLQSRINNKNYSSQHFRLSIASPKAILQLRFTKPVKEENCEEQKPKTINAGLLSWNIVPKN